VFWQLDLDGFALPIKQLKGTDPVDKLDLSSKGLWAASAIVIAKCIEVNGVLISLNVGWNKLTEEAALGIVRAVRQQDKMTELGLSKCKISASGAREIADYVRVSSVLTKLDVGVNDLDEQATLGIVRAARQQDTMVSLGLQYCKIGASGAQEIADYVRVSSVLTEVSLSQQVLTASHRLPLTTYLWRAQVDLKANKLDEASEATLREIEKGRPSLTLKL